MAGLPVGPVSAGKEEAQAFYADALGRYQARDYGAAVIQARNALREDETHMAARILLAKGYIGTRRYRAAEATVRRAQQDGADADALWLPLGEVLLGLHRFDRVLEELPKRHTDPTLSREITAIRAEALLQLRRPRIAIGLFQQVLGGDPNSIAALTGLSRAYLAVDDEKNALKFQAAARRLAPRSEDVHMLDAIVARRNNDADAALRAYSAAIAVNAHVLTARIGRLATYLDRDQAGLAKDDLDWLQANAAHDPRVAYFSARYLASTGQLQEARTQLDDAANRLSQIDDSVFAQNADLALVAGMVALGQNRLTRAERYLEWYVDLRPKQAQGRRALASIKTALGKPRAALDLLSGDDRVKDDARTLRVRASALARLGRHKEAARDLERALSLQPDDPNLIQRLATTLTAAGEDEAAIARLRGEFDSGSERRAIGAMLALLHLRRGELKALATVAQRLDEEDKGDPFPPNILGSALLARGDVPRAVPLFAEALKRDPNYHPARHNLAVVAVRIGDLARANAELEQILADDPRNEQALLLTARLAENAGNVERAAVLLQRADGGGRISTIVAERLIRLYGRTERRARLSELANRLEATALNDLERLELALQALIAARQRDEAFKLLDRIAATFAVDARATFRIGRFWLGLGEIERALAQFDAAIALDPEFLPARGARIEVLLRRNEVIAAEAAVDKLLARFPDSAVLHIARGDVWMRRERPALAAKSYMRAFARNATPSVLLRVTRARRELGQDTVSLLETWLQGHPDDVLVRRALASEYQRLARSRDATRLYRGLLARYPSDPILLNNAALLAHEIGDDKALEMAREAQRLAPNAPEILDTLGWLLSLRGQHKEAISWLRRAEAGRPFEPEIQLHLAHALAGHGDRDAARQVLAKVQAERLPVPARAHYRELQQSLEE